MKRSEKKLSGIWTCSNLGQIQSEFARLSGDRWCSCWRCREAHDCLFQLGINLIGYGHHVD